MKIEFDIEIGSGIWKPAEDLIVMARDAFDLRHNHDNKETLDKFEINTAKTRPVFGGEILASQGDVTGRVSELRTVTPNYASVEDSYLKLQRKVGSDITDLFSVELPKNDVSGLTEEQAKNLKDCTNEKHSHENSDVINNITAIESEVKSDSDNPVSSSAVAEELNKIHKHDNKAILDLIGQEGENLTFNGKEITASDTDNYRVIDALVVAKMLEKSDVTVVSCKPSEAINDNSYTDAFYGIALNQYIIYVPIEDGELQCFSTETFEFTDTIDVHAGTMLIWHYDIHSVLNRYLKQGKEILDVLINGLESLS